MFSADVFCAKHDFPPKNGPVPSRPVNVYHEPSQPVEKRGQAPHSRRFSQRFHSLVRSQSPFFNRLLTCSRVGSHPSGDWAISRKCLRPARPLVLDVKHVVQIGDGQNLADLRVNPAQP